MSASTFLLPLSLFLLLSAFFSLSFAQSTCNAGTGANLAVRIDQGNNRRSASVSHLYGRQTVIPNVPAQCRPTCDPVNTIVGQQTGCTPKDCCTDTFINFYAECFVCIGNITGITNWDVPQCFLDSLVVQCSLEGLPIDNVTLPGENRTRTISTLSTGPTKSSSSSSTSARTTITALSTTTSAPSQQTTTPNNGAMTVRLWIVKDAWTACLVTLASLAAGTIITVM